MWEKLVRLSLIGTERGNLTEEERFELQAIGIDTDEELTQVVLTGLALYGQMQRAGKTLDTHALQSLSVAPKDPLPSCDSAVVKLLNLILSDYPQILPELARNLIHAKKRLPEEGLPDILQIGIEKPETWAYLKEIVGTRGIWLAQQNPDWQGLVNPPDIQTWTVGNQKERLQILYYLRVKDPNQALDLIQSTWEEDSLQDKIAFIKALSKGLNQADESFLEACLDNSRKEIRIVAANVLTLLPNAELLERHFQRVIACFSLRKEEGIKLTVELPTEAGPDLIRDGVNPKSQWFKGGLRASLFGQMMAVIPPTRWNDYFQTSTSEVLAIFYKTKDYGQLLVQAVIEAAALHREEHWGEALLLFWMENREKKRWQNLDVTNLLEVINKSTFNKVALIGLQQSNLLEEADPICALLRNSKHVWEDRLTLQFFQTFSNWVKWEYRTWTGWHYASILKNAAFYCNPKLKGQLMNFWTNEEGRVWKKWEKNVNEFSSILDFRIELLKTIHGIGK